MPRAAALRDALGHALGRDLHDLRLDPRGGGCINSAALLLADGERFFVKWNDRRLPGQFAAEAAGLRALRESGTSLAVPQPIAWSDAGPGESFLILEHLDAGAARSDFDDALVRGLAELHRASSPHGFGFASDGYCGATAQPNGWFPDWATFYQQRRLGPQIVAAARRDASSTSRAIYERLLERLPQLLEAEAPPALIHGDLWSGNLYVTADGRPALIDPAAYFGHREAELGMMVLFGGFSRALLDAYATAADLAPGWRDRLPLYALYHVLNHAQLFGGAYDAQALALARRFV